MKDLINLSSFVLYTMDTLIIQHLYLTWNNISQTNTNLAGVKKFNGYERKMVGLDQNEFYNGSKCYWLEKDNNGLTSKYTLKNIFINKYTYLDLFILTINVIIHLKVYKPSKQRSRKNAYWTRKILARGEGKKIKKMRSWIKCGIKG